MMIYRNLRRSFQSEVQRDKPLFGELGYAVDGEFRVVHRPDNPYRYRVRVESGEFLILNHDGNVAPVPNMRVELHYVKGTSPARNKLKIKGPDAEWAARLNVQAQSNLHVGIHSHHWGSGNEFPVHPLMLSEFQVRRQGNFVIELSSGNYLESGNAFHFPLSTVDLSSLKPSPNKARWVVVGVDTENHTTYVQPLPEDLPVNAGELSDIVPQVITAKRLPVAALLLYGNNNDVNWQDIHSLLFLSFQRSGSSGAGSGIIGDVLDAIVVHDNAIVFHDNNILYSEV